MKRFLWRNLMVSGLTLGLMHSAPADEAAAGKAEVGSSERSVTERATRPRTGETRYDWKWLAARYDKDENGAVTAEELPVTADVFGRLDRTWDGKLASDDFDWSENTVLRLQKDSTFSLFKAVDTSSDGRITAEEWQAVFAKAVEKKGFLDDDDLEKLIFLPRVLKAQRDAQRRPDRPEVAAANRKPRTEAPKLGEMAPDFSLSSPDGLTKVQLSSLREKRPVALIFGSFT